MATDLDDVLFVSIAERVADVILFPAMYMPNFHFSEGQIQDLVNALLAKGGGRDPQRKATPTVVHFEEQGRRDEIPFVKHCGPCHKLLASRYGGLGRGDIGPNLSGLFTEHYPRAFMEGPPWSPEKVRDWLKNPRAIRPLATMQPVALTPEEFHAVCSTILLDSGGLGAHPEASGFGPIFLESPSVAPPSGRGVPQGGRTSQ